MHRNRFCTLCALTLLLFTTLAGQVAAQDRQAQHIYAPMASQKAAVSQTIGVTELKVHYHRPAVNERTIWGALVPHGQIWRTGANENTTFSTSTEVTVEGQTLKAGKYGLFTIPGEGEWTVVFSKDNASWGSSSYDEANDVLRVQVTPSEAPHQERMGFTFEDVSNDGATLTLHWEKVRVPVRIEAKTHELALASFREQLKGLSQFFWQGWNQAANYCLQNEINYEEAMEWVERSIQTQATFANLSTKAQLLAKMGQGEEVEAIMEKAVEKGNAGNLYAYGRQLLSQGDEEKALEIMQMNVKRHPEAWFVEFGLAFPLSALGQYDKAAAAMKTALEKAPDNNKPFVQGLLDRLEKGEDINN